jgi:hypothetical protein
MASAWLLCPRRLTDRGPSVARELMLCWCACRRWTQKRLSSCTMANECTKTTPRKWHVPRAVGAQLMGGWILYAVERAFLAVVACRMRYDVRCG